MDILGIGVPEFFFIVVIALIVLGPKDMQKAGKTLGSWMRKIVTSEEWRGIKNASRQLKTLPNELMREANLDELNSEFDKYRNEKVKVTLPKDDFGTWGGRPAPHSASENNIAPPVDDKPASVKKADDAPILNSPSDDDFRKPDNNA